MGTGYLDQPLGAEQRARVLIDRQLADAGWSVQDRKDLNLFAAQGVACREVVMTPGHGRADYLLYVDQRGRRRHRGQARGHHADREAWEWVQPPATRVQIPSPSG